MRLVCLVALVLPLVAADAPPNPSATASIGHKVRATGVIRAVKSVMIQAPRIEGQGGQLTLATLIENGKVVAPGDELAVFDPTNEQRLKYEAQARFDDIRHQVEQKQAEHNNNAEGRASTLKGAEADLQKAQLEIRKGPVLSEIERQKNQVKLEDAQAHVESLKKSNVFRDQAELAEIKIFELQRDRQKVTVERQTNNLNKLDVKAPIKGMVALENIWRNNSMGHAQEGDQMWPGQPLLRLFDPSEMEVELAVGEPDGGALVKGAKATVHLDAFPELTFTAHFDSASPVATSPLATSIKTFTARFRLDQTDPHLLPDLSAALDIEAPVK
jgi:HlyD family secretion protein